MEALLNKEWKVTVPEGFHVMDDAERAAMGARGRAWIQRDFSWKGIGAQMKAAYEWLLAPEKVERPEWVRVE